MVAVLEVDEVGRKPHHREGAGVNARNGTADGQFATDRFCILNLRS
jgi:hypothetical protein